jgi:hypothetical protein
LVVALLCLLAAVGCPKSKWPKNQDPQVEKKVLDAFKEWDDEVGTVTRSTRLSVFFDTPEDKKKFLEELADDFDVTLPADAERGLRTVGDVIDLMGFLAAQTPPTPKTDAAVPEPEPAK